MYLFDIVEVVFEGLTSWVRRVNCNWEEGCSRTSSLTIPVAVWIESKMSSGWTLGG